MYEYSVDKFGILNFLCVLGFFGGDDGFFVLVRIIVLRFIWS